MIPLLSLTISERFGDKFPHNQALHKSTALRFGIGNSKEVRKFMFVQQSLQLTLSRRRYDNV